VVTFIEIPVPEALRRTLEPGTRAFRASHCGVLLSRNGPAQLWHLSISHPHRYPNWDEIHDARYQLVPDEVTMAMILPPKADYVNLHPNCFHLHQIMPEEYQRGAI
jgi:hypothetical protein